MARSVTFSFELLRTFVALVRADGEASAVLERLGLNQPTLSKRLKHLQHAGSLLEHPWLVRNGKRWELTDEGRRVWPAVVALVDRYDDMQSFLEGGATGPAPVNFACGQLMAAGVVRTALREFRRQSPRAALRISTLRGRARIEGVSNGSLDLAIVTHDEPAIHEIARRRLHVEPLCSHGLALVCAVGSPWQRSVRALPRGGVSATSLAGFPLIVPEPDAAIRQMLDAVALREGTARLWTIALEIGGWRTILDYVRDGLGVGVVSEAAVDEPHGLIVRRLDTAVFPRIEAKLICRRPAPSNEAVNLSETALAWREAIRKAASSSHP